MTGGEPVVAAAPEPPAADEYRVAVVMFCAVPKSMAADELDASGVAELAIRQNLGEDGSTSLPRSIELRMNRTVYDVEVVAARDVGVAAGNGYLWVGPTNRAFNEVAALRAHQSTCPTTSKESRDASRRH